MDPIIRERIRLIRARIDDLLSRYPAHSIPPAMVVELDELEVELELVVAQLNAITENTNSRSNEHSDPQEFKT